MVKSSRLALFSLLSPKNPRAHRPRFHIFFVVAEKVSSRKRKRRRKHLEGNKMNFFGNISNKPCGERGEKKKQSNNFHPFLSLARCLNDHSAVVGFALFWFWILASKVTNFIAFFCRIFEAFYCNFVAFLSHF